MMTEIDDRRWQAVRDRERADGFVFGVRTTRIVCRPGCPARTPRRDHVVCFDDVTAALAAGFRPCKRCRPDDAAPDADEQRLIARACASIDADPARRLADVAAAVGLSRFHFARRFHAVVGVTAAAYRRARREDRLRRELAAGSRVLDAAAVAGFGSAGRVYDGSPLGMTPTAFRAGAPGERIVFALGESSLGTVLVARASGGICAIELGDDAAAATAVLRRDFPQAHLVRDDDALARDLSAAIAAADGCDNAALLDLDVRGTAFRRRVWDALRAIPAGQTRTYGQLAAALGTPAAARAVAAACARNPLALAVPCHRAVGADGEARGYRWGVARKRALLARERETG